MEGLLFYRPTTLEDGYLQQTLNRLLHLSLRTIPNLNLGPFPLCPMKSPVLETGVNLLTNLIIVGRGWRWNIQQLSHFTKLCDKNRFRSRRPPSFQDSNSGSQAVKSLPVRENTVRRTQASNSERIQVCERLLKLHYVDIPLMDMNWNKN